MDDIKLSPLQLAAITFITSVAADLIKRAYEPFFDSFKNANLARKSHESLLNPIYFSSRDLFYRLDSLIKNDGDFDYARFRYRDIWRNYPPEKREAHAYDDDYVIYHKFKSTLYRISSLIGWLEIYRRNVIMIDRGESKRVEKFMGRIAYLNTWLSDVRILDDNLPTQPDFTLMRDEIRGIGALVIDSETRSSVIDFGKFEESFDREDNFFRNISNLRHYFVDIHTESNKRKKIRLIGIALAVYDIMCSIPNKKPDKYIRDRVTIYKGMLR